MANDPQQPVSRPTTAWPWALITGLAVGFLVGREVGPRRAGEATDEGKKTAPSAVAAAATYKSEAEFPAGWLKSADLASVAGISFDGLSDQQKASALQALNEHNCECGCGMGSIAACAKKDPNCPRSPKIAKQVVDMAKAGKTYADMLAYIDTENPKRGAAAPAANDNAPAPAGAHKVPLAAWSPRTGPKNAKVTIVEFSDFQCPFCKRATATVKEVEQKYPKDVAVIFRNQPLPFHDKAQGAAQAFMAANKQGKAWALHDKMFDNNTALTPEDLERYAKEIGLDVAKWKKDLDDPAVKKQIDDDKALGSQVGADGTPTFFINGRQLVGAQPFDSFKAIIDEEIKKADDLLKKGTKPGDLYEKLMDAALAAAPAAAPGNAAPAAPPSKVNIDIGDSPVMGPKDAKVTLIAFSDFQCPFCSRVVPTLKQVEDTYKGKIRVAFKNLPLPFHDHAKLAAEAAMAANAQGRFWDYHDKLFANQQHLERADLERYAQDLGLDMGKFKGALDAGTYKDRVEKDATLAGTVGASGTPTFFVNGTPLVGAQPFDAFKTAIDGELAKAK